MHCINSMFNNQIVLTVNKRMKNETDRIILKCLKDDIFNLNINVMEMFKKYKFNIINNIDLLETTKKYLTFVQEHLK